MSDLCHHGEKLIPNEMSTAMRSAPEFLLCSPDLGVFYDAEYIIKTPVLKYSGHYPTWLFVHHQYDMSHSIVSGFLKTWKQKQIQLFLRPFSFLPPPIVRGFLTRQSMFDPYICSFAVSQNTILFTWRRHAMQALSALQTICEGKLSAAVGFPLQRSSQAEFHILFDVISNSVHTTHLSFRWFGMPWFSMTRFFYILSAMDDDDLSTQKAKASAIMTLSEFPGNSPTSAPESNQPDYHKR